MTKRVHVARSRLVRALSLATLVVAAGCARQGASPPAPARSVASLDSKGTEFWIMFDPNGAPTTQKTLAVYLTSDVAATGQVEIPGLGFAQGFTVDAGGVTSVTLPWQAEVLISNTVESKGVRITASARIAVYGHNDGRQAGDAFTALPTDVLGTEYLALGHTGAAGGQVGVLAIRNGTTVTITPSAQAGVHPAGLPFTLTMDAGETFLLQSSTPAQDLTGSIVTASSPVAVFSGALAANVPDVTFGGSQGVVEQLPPTTAWGTRFVTVPFANRLRGDAFRFLAAMEGTVLTINGTVATTLGRGQFHETFLTGPSVVEASAPILVAQLAAGGSYDHGIETRDVEYDPTMILVPPSDRFLDRYTVVTPRGFLHDFINVVAPASAVGGITLDGALIPASRFTAIGTSGFAGAQLAVGPGTHDLSAAVPFGVLVYGSAVADAYGYAGGLTLPAFAGGGGTAATVTRIVLAPAPGLNERGELCLLATVTDAASDPVPDVVVTFDLTGPNARTATAQAAADGVATWCYRGTNAGTDLVTASVGTVSAQASVTWSAPPAEYTVVVSSTSASVGETACVVATLTDAGGAPVANVPVTFSAAGANVAAGSVHTGTNGTAPFCYTGASVGTDTVTATAGGASATGTVTWAAAVSYRLTLELRGDGAGSVAGTANGVPFAWDACSSSGCTKVFTARATVELVETPAAGSVFLGWGIQCAGPAPRCSFTVAWDRAVVATFGRDAYPLSVTMAGAGVGTVTSNVVAGAQVACTTGSADGCSVAFPAGAAVLLTPSFDATRYVFQGWSGACRGAGACTVAMTDVRSVTATFAPARYGLAVLVGGSGAGTVTGPGIACSSGSSAGCSADQPNGAVVTLTAKEAAGSVFKRWDACPYALGTSCTLTMAAARTVDAIFEPAEYGLKLSMKGPGRGTVTGTADGVPFAWDACGPDPLDVGGTICTATIANGVQVVLTESPTEGSTFAGWAVVCAGTSRTCAFKMNSPKNPWAAFVTP